MVEQLVAPLLRSKKVLGSAPGCGSFCVEFACSPRVYVGSHQLFNSGMRGKMSLSHSSSHYRRPLRQACHIHKGRLLG
ncbi:hypothetical protein ATANTOWER_012778 [Ataeniobius toweri]|uniref:Uncharacterized protein n=1 Tax=Ataeniobius toweri TaxID=208326 RepID=A0ABU7AFZ1_9TELE|nr:hypothetical protein [Ataeniobius toweri]